MTKRTRSSALYIASCLLFLAAGSANAEVIRCSDNAGSITYTDVPCVAGSQTGSQKAQVPSVMPISTAGKSFPGQESLAAAEKARSVAALINISNGRVYSLDERMVRGAKASSDTMDVASELVRQQASAERALQVNRWAFWRL